MKWLLILSVLLVSISAHAQWRKIADFAYVHDAFTTLYESVQSVYFLDLPGPPRVGFVGTDAALYKTTNGGKSFTQVWTVGGHYGLYAVSDICFKDTLTGWFTIVDGGGASADTVGYRTTDGGNTWKPIEIPGSVYGANGVYYNRSTNRLFIGPSGYSAMKLSTDLGDHWQSVTNIETGGIGFFSDSVGIAAAYPDSAFSSGPFLMRTVDGGLNWKPVFYPSTGTFGEPLIIHGTSTCFEEDFNRFTVRRSDDCGQTWRVIKDFGPPVDTTPPGDSQIAPYSNGVICGDLSRLSVLTDSGVYVSTDEGVTWKLEPGSPGYANGGTGCQIFYSAKGITIAGASNGVPVGDQAAQGGLYSGEGLWEEDWSFSGVTPSAAPAGPDISVYPNPTTGVVTISGASGTVVVENVLGSGDRGPKSGTRCLEPGPRIPEPGHSIFPGCRRERILCAWRLLAG